MTRRTEQVGGELSNIRSFTTLLAVNIRVVMAPLSIIVMKEHKKPTFVRNVGRLIQAGG